MIRMIKRIRRLLCRIGIHQWSDLSIVSHHDSKKSYRIYKICRGCKLIKK